MVWFGSRRGAAGGLSLYLMVGTFLSVGALLYWLSVRAAPVEVEVVEGEEAVREEVATAPVVDNGVFGADPMAHEGMRIRLNGLRVGNVIGPRAFFLQVPNQVNDYLVGTLPEALMQDEEVVGGSTVSLIGTVHPGTAMDSVAAAWIASGAIPESQGIVVEFALSYFEAEQVDVTGQAQPEPDDN